MPLQVKFLAQWKSESGQYFVQAIRKQSSNAPEDASNEKTDKPVGFVVQQEQTEAPILNGTEVPEKVKTPERPTPIANKRRTPRTSRLAVNLTKNVKQ